MTPHCCPPSRSRFLAGIALICVLAALVSVFASETRAAEEGLRELRLPPNAVEVDPRPEYGFEVPESAYPLQPVEQTPYQGARHGFLNTTTGGIVFRVDDFRLPGRMPIAMGRVYDSKLSTSLPPPPLKGSTEARWTQDLGENWILSYSSYLIADGPNYILATPEGDLIKWLYQGTANYVRADHVPSEHLKFKRESPKRLVETRADGVRWIYDAGVMAGAAYGLTRIEDRSGNAIHLTWQSGYLKQIQNTDGATVTITRPMFQVPPPQVNFPTTRITRLTDSTGRQVNFNYDSLGRLTTVTDVMNQNWTYGYTPQHKLTTATNPGGQVYFNASYDTSHRVSSFTADAGAWTVTYLTGLSKTQLTNALNDVWVYDYLPLNGITSRITEPTGGAHEFTFDSNTNPLSYTDPEGVTSNWTWDSLQRPLTYTPPGAAPDAIEYVYHSKLWVESVTGLDDGVTTFTRDSTKGLVLEEETPDGARWTSTYAANGDRSTLKLPKGNEPGATDDFQWSFVHDSFGSLTRATDPTGRVFHFEYTTRGDVSKIRRPDRIEQGQLVYADWTYTRDAAGRITAITNPLNETWTRSYDSSGRLITLTGPGGTQIRYGWDARYRLTSVTLEGGDDDPITSYGYDAAGRLATKTVPTGSIWTYVHDGTGRLISTTDPLTRTWGYERDLAGRVETLTYPGGQEVTLARDSAGRLETRTLPGGHVESLTWDTSSRLTSSRSSFEGGAWVGTLEWDYDTMGRPNRVTTTVDDGGVQSRSIALDYDANGNRIELTSPGGETRGFFYDELDRLVSTTSDLYDDWSVSYHPQSGHRAGLASGARYRNWTYDAAGRLVLHQWDLGGDELGDEAYGYDAEGRPVLFDDLIEGLTRVATLNTLGFPSSVQDSGGSAPASAYYTYDESGQLTNVLRDLGATTEETSFARDAAGRLTRARRGNRERLYTWDDQPGDPAAMLRLWRSPTAPVEPAAEILYGFDGRLSGVISHELGEEPYLTAQYRWSPLVAGRVLGSQERNSENALNTRWIASDAGGYYAELDGASAVTATVHPVLSADEGRQALLPSYGVALPRIGAPFGLGTWSRLPGMGQQSGVTALTDVVTGLVQGRAERRVLEAFERSMDATIGTTDEFHPGPSEFRDDWLDGYLRFGRPEGDGQSGFESVIATADEGSPLAEPVHGAMADEQQCHHGVICNETPQEMICLCEGLVFVYDLAPASSTSPVSPCCPYWSRGGVPENPPPPFEECTWSYGRAFGNPDVLRSPDISPTGVSLWNGDFIRDETDLSVYDKGGPVEFSRTYRSGMDFESDLGYRWTHNWNERLVFSIGTNSATCGSAVRWLRSDGSYIDFWFNEEGEPYGPPSGIDRIRKIEIDPNDGFVDYEIRSLDGTIRLFRRYGTVPEAQMQQQRLGGTVLDLDYFDPDPAGVRRLEQVKSGSQALLKFFYDDEHLTRVESGLTPSTRWVAFEYTDCGELEWVRRPPTALGYDKTGAWVGPTDGPDTRYTYENPTSGTFPCTTTAPGYHLLTRIDDRQHDPLTGVAGMRQQMRNVYQTTGPAGGNDASYRRVIRQCLGETDCEASSTTAEIEYGYVHVSGNPPEAEIRRRREAGGDQVIERHVFNENGFLTELIEDAAGLARTSHYTYNGYDVMFRTDFPDGTCELTEYTWVAGGAMVPYRVTSRVKERCDGGSGGEPDRITYLTYENYTGQVRSVIGPEAFPTGSLPAGFDPTHEAWRPYRTDYFYDFDEGYSEEMATICADWDLICPDPESTSDLNGDTSDDDNWFGNVVKIEQYAVSPSSPAPPGFSGTLSTRHVYNSLGRPIRQIGPDGTGTETWYYTEGTPGTGGAKWDWRAEPAPGESLDGAGPVSKTLRLANDASAPILLQRTAWSAEAIPEATEDGLGVRIERTLATSGQTLHEEVRRYGSSPGFLRQTDLSYDLLGRAVRAAVRDSEGVELSEAWTTWNDLGQALTTTIDPDPNAIPGGASSIPDPGSEDPQHLRSRTFYDRSGRVTHTVSPGNRVTCFTYDDLDRTITTRRQAAPHVDGTADCPAVAAAEDIVTTAAYDAMDRPIVQTDETGVATWNWYDAYGRPEYVSDGEPQGPDASPYINIAWLGTIISAPMATWWGEQAYDNRGRLVRSRSWGWDGKTKDAAGLPVRGLLAASWERFDNLGRTIGRDLAVDALYLSGASNAAGSLTPPTGLALATSWGVFNSKGQVEKTIDVRDFATELFYDGLGRRRLVQQEEVFGYRDQSEVFFDSVGRPWKSEATAYSDNGESVTTVNKVEYDSWGRVQRRIGDPDAARLITDFDYDPLGRVRLQAGRWDEAPEDLPTLDPNDRAVETLYDRVGRVRKTRVRKAHPDTWTDTEYRYDRDGLTTSQIDAEMNESNWTYDARAVLTSMLYPAAAGVRQEVAFTAHDHAGRPTEVQFRGAASGSAPRIRWTIDYDARGRMVSRVGETEQVPGGGPEFSGTTEQTYTYDDLGRIVSADDISGTGPDATIRSEYRFDSASRVVEEHQRLPLGGVLVDHAVESEYDTTGFRRELHFPVVPGYENDRYWLNFTSTSRGQLQGIQGPLDATDGTVARQRGTLANYKWIGGAVWSRWYRNVTISKAYDENGSVLTPLFDGLGRPTGVRTWRVEPENEFKQISDYRYGYDRVGNPTFEQRRHEPTNAEATLFRTRAWTTDLRGRLSRWAQGPRGLTDVIPLTNATDPAAVFGSSPAEGERFTLDDTGNWTDYERESKPEENATFATNSLNQYTSIVPDGAGALPFDYDWLGQMRLNPPRGQRYVWDAFGRLSEVWDTTSEPDDELIASYRYDAFNRRVEKTVPPGTGDETTRYIYDGWRAIEERAVVAGAEVVRARYGFGVGLDEVLWMDRDEPLNGGEPGPGGSPDGTIESRYYVHHDHKGSAIAVTSDPANDPLTRAAATVVERYEYTEYGKVAVHWAPEWAGDSYGGPPLATSRVRLPYLYTGQRQDAETGLYYFKNRYFDAGIGRFLRRDLIGYSDGPNLYRYANGNPTAFRDPLGLASCATGWQGCGDWPQGPGGFPGGRGPGGPGGAPRGNPNSPCSGGGPSCYVIGDGSITESERFAYERRVRQECESGMHGGSKGDFCSRIDDPYRHIVVGRSDSGKVEFKRTGYSDTPWPEDRKHLVNAYVRVTAEFDRLFLGGAPGFPPGQTVAYLVSRPLNVKLASKFWRHNFVVVGARFVGDPDATSYSYGMREDGTVGQVDDTTEGFSEGTSAEDWEAWLSMNGATPGDPDVVLIPAPTAVVEAWAQAVTGGVLDYAASGAFGWNSNGAAQAVGNRSAGFPLPVPGPPRSSPGAEDWRGILFDGP